ncbi:MAG: NADH-quinone oxidoreductase subunit NuoE [Armatimonadota bacterium]
MADTLTSIKQPDAGPSEADITALFDRLAVSRDSNLIGVLQSVQDTFGYLPMLAIKQINERTGIPLSRIYGVITFYAQFYTEPRGKHTVRCCTGTACHVKGAGKILDAVERELKIKDGETTDDLMFCLETVACLGTCFLAPVIMIDEQYFGNLTSARVERILRSYRTKYDETSEIS